MKTVLIVLFLLLLPSINTFALDNDVKKMLSDASGITEEDTRAALQKNTTGLFDIYALAVNNTERLAIEGENSIQSEARRSQAFGAFLPKLYLRGNKYFADDYISKSGSQRDTISLYARQPIMTGLEEYSTLKSSRSDVKIKKYSLYNNASLLLFDVAVNFYNVIQIEKNIKSNVEILNLYKLTINELNRRASIGRSRRSEVQRTNSELYKVEAVLKSLNNSLTHARLVLKTLTGFKNDLTLKEGDYLPDPAYNISSINNILTERWDIKSAIESVKQADARVAAAYGMNLPSIYVDGTYLLYSEDQKEFSASYNKNDYYFSIGAELPIFTGGIAIARLKEAKSIKRQAELYLTKTTRLAEQDVIDSYQSWESSKNEVAAYEKALKSAEENYKTVNNEYRLNLVTILDVITTLKSLQSARDDYESSVLQSKLNRIRLGIAVNEFSGNNIKLLKQK